MKLEIDCLQVKIAEKTILDQVSLHVANKQLVGLLGPNGCGKSTLLRSIYHMVHPSCGTVNLDEIDVLRTPVKTLARYLSVVSQFNELNFDFSVRQMVSMGRSPHKGLLERENETDKEIIDRAIHETGLDEFADRSYSSLSGGEKQRVVLARAIAQSPQFMLLDEPTNHLDIKYQIQILSIVRSLGIGVLTALHDLTLAANYCDYLYLMKSGKIYAQGTPEEVLTPGNIREVFEVNCEVYRNPFNGKLTVIYLD